MRGDTRGDAVDRWGEAVHVRVAAEHRAALARLAHAQQRTTSSVIREAIATYLATSDDRRERELTHN